MMSLSQVGGVLVSKYFHEENDWEGAKLTAFAFFSQSQQDGLVVFLVCQ